MNKPFFVLWMILAVALTVWVSYLLLKPDVFQGEESISFEASEENKILVESQSECLETTIADNSKAVLIHLGSGKEIESEKISGDYHAGNGCLSPGYWRLKNSKYEGQVFASITIESGDFVRVTRWAGSTDWFLVISGSFLADLLLIFGGLWLAERKYLTN